MELADDGIGFSRDDVERVGLVPCFQARDDRFGIQVWFGAFVWMDERMVIGSFPWIRARSYIMGPLKLSGSEAALVANSGRPRWRAG